MEYKIKSTTVTIIQTKQIYCPYCNEELVHNIDYKYESMKYGNQLKCTNCKKIFHISKEEKIINRDI